MKILLAIDGSACSDAAVEEVARRPWPQGSTVKVLTAVESTPALPVTPEVWALPPHYFEELDGALRQQGRNIVEHALQKLKCNKTVLTDAVLAPGSPRPAILDEAEHWPADLIVMGSHGYGGWKRLLLGSVSQAVVSHAKCSVEVVRCPASGKPPKSNSKRRRKVSRDGESTNPRGRVWWRSSGRASGRAAQRRTSDHACVA